jgi:hypothetical protein
MITFTLDCVVGQPTSSGAEGRFSIKSIFLYARRGVVDGWGAVSGVRGLPQMKPNLPASPKKSSHVTEKNALGHFTTPQKEQPDVQVCSVRPTNQVIRLMGKSIDPHCDGLRISTSLRSLRRLGKTLYENKLC